MSFERFEVYDLIIPLFIIFFSHTWIYSEGKDFKKLASESTPDFDPKVFSLYDVVIKDALTKLGTLSNLSNINETSIHNSVKLKSGVHSQVN